LAVQCSGGASTQTRDRPPQPPGGVLVWDVERDGTFRERRRLPWHWVMAEMSCDGKHWFAASFHLRRLQAADRAALAAAGVEEGEVGRRLPEAEAELRLGTLCDVVIRILGRLTQTFWPAAS